MRRKASKVPFVCYLLWCFWRHSFVPEVVSYIWIGMLVMHLLLTSWSAGSTPRIFKEETRQTKRETNGFRILSAIFAQQKPLLIQFGVQFHPFSKKMPWFHSLAGGNHLGTCGTNWMGQTKGRWNFFTLLQRGPRKTKDSSFLGAQKWMRFGWVSKISP